MLRLVSLIILTVAWSLPWPRPATADEFDSLINLDLAFRNAILKVPAPKRFQSLIREGETTVTFVPNFPATVGKTDFFQDLTWSYGFEYETEQVGGRTNVTVVLTNVKVTPRLRHVIRLPLSFYTADVWETPLLSHEFDHVAISLDPRPLAMLFELCSNLPPYRFVIKGEDKPSDKQMQEGIDRELKHRHSAILDLIRANYAALDKVSTHGRTMIEKRQEFFETLYTKSNLTAEAFPYVKELTLLFESEAYRKLRPRNVAGGPVR